MPRTLRRLVLATLVLATASLGITTRGCARLEFPDYAVLQLAPGPDLEDRLRAALQIVKPGTVIELPAGHYAFREEIEVRTSHVVLRGQGYHETVLDFSQQSSGAQAFLVLADAFVAQEFAIENPKGDGIRAEGTNGVVFDQVRVEWTNGPDTDNGAYGLYPVGCSNVLVQNSVVSGASDAGIYVGQSRNIIVRKNRVEYNVAGIEIENSQDADVYLNVTTNNTGGILVFDLRLPVAGMRTRVFNNLIFGNNTPNFAPAGNIVGNVPTGTGIIVMANRDIEIFENWIDDHDTVSVAIVSFSVLDLPVRTPKEYPDGYDPYPERIHVHDNIMTNVGANPSGDLGLFAFILFQATGGMPDILYDGILENDIEYNLALPESERLGILNEKTDFDTGTLRADRRICLQDNGDADFGDMNELRLPVSRDASGYDCSYPPLAEVVLDPFPPVPDVPVEYTPEEIAALCNAPGQGPNWDAFVVDCPNLSDYRLFAGGDPTGTPLGGGVPYDLTTPLFSDYSSKYRTVFLPPGTQAYYDDAGVFSFPVGTIIAKHFAFPADLRDPSLGERWVETRLLIHRADGWAGLPFVWAEDRSAATLTPLGTARLVEFVHFDGALRQIDYRVPNVTQCSQCHGNALEPARGSLPIGPTARLLNKTYPYPTGAENQLVHWQAQGILDVTAGEIAVAPRLPVWDDPTDGTLDQRARAYLESNCAHCHSPTGRARFSGLFLEADRPLGFAVGVCKPPVAAGIGAGDDLYDIVPGAPDDSILVFRMEDLRPAVRMPELSKAIVHAEGVALVRSWVLGLPPQACE